MKSMQYFNYDNKKALQAVAYFLKLNENKMNYTKLIKLVYIADRRLLKKYGMVLTGGVYSALQHGPINSNLFDDIKLLKKNRNTSFSKYFKIDSSDEYSLILVDNPGEDCLNKISKQMIEDLSKEFSCKDYWFMINYCHKFCEEWSDPQGHSKKIPIKDIIKDTNNELIENVKFGIYSSNNNKIYNI